MVKSLCMGDGRSGVDDNAKRKDNKRFTGVFLNVLRKQADGEWKLSHHMWDDAISKR